GSTGGTAGAPQGGDRQVGADHPEGRRLCRLRSPERMSPQSAHGRPVMLPRLRNPKDFWTGVIYLVVGLGAVLLARAYPLGTARRMGPAYFPTVLGYLLAILGLVAVVRAFIQPGAAIGKFA